jgi:hypothetical protein
MCGEPLCDLGLSELMSAAAASSRSSQEGAADDKRRASSAARRPSQAAKAFMPIATEVRSASTRPPQALLAPSASVESRVSWLARCTSASAARHARAAFSTASGLCKNMSLQAGSSRRTFVAPSRMPGAGWGLFLDDRPAVAGDFLIEYGAEVVSSDESSRRGAIYDIFNRSYILALTKDADLDATALGNKARFINHSAKPNARAATVVAGGSRRVGLFATQTILSGEEITFNYGYGTKVDWQSDFRLSGRHRSSADVARSSAPAAAEPAAAASSDVAVSATSSLPRWQPGKKQKNN